MSADASGGFVWEDCTFSQQVGASIVQGDGYWPSLINVDATDLSGSITSDDARALARLLVNAANACDVSTAKFVPAAASSLVTPGEEE